MPLLTNRPVEVPCVDSFDVVVEETQSPGITYRRTRWGVYCIASIREGTRVVAHLRASL